MTRRLQTAAYILAVAAVYFCVGKFGLSLALVNPSASAIWPPTGLALAATLLWGYRLWPGIFLGAFLVNFTTPGNPATDLGIAVGNTIEALLGAWWVNRFARGAKVFDRARDIFRFVLLAAMLSTVVGASVGVTSVCLGREARWEQYPAIWFTWWVGDMMGNLIVAPLLLIWLRRPWPRLRPAQVQEAAGLLVAVIFVCILIFLGAIPSDQGNQLKYLAILPLLWAAFRFRQRGAIVCAFAISGIALWSTLQGLGPFATPDPNRSLLFLQAFVGTMTLAALVVAAVVSEGQRFEQRLCVQNAVSRVLAESNNLKQVEPKIAQTLCEVAGWDAGAVWRVDRTANELRCVDFWHVPSLDVQEFADITRQGTRAPGIGLPGRVWSSGQPVWIPDVTQDSNFPRAPIAQKEGMHGAVCFPIKLGDEVLGVLECFSRRVREPDPEFLQMLANLGSQVGQFMERTLTEEALREAHEQMLSLIEQAPLSMAMFDREMRYIATSRRWIAEYGRGYSHLTGRSHYELHPDLPEQWKDAHKKGLAGETLSNESDLWVQADGSKNWLRWAVQPWRDARGEIGGIIISAEDITERQRVEERLRLVVEAAPNAMIMVGEDGRIAMVNAQAEKLFGYGRAELLGRAIELLVPERFRARHPGMRQGFFASPQARAMGAGRDLYGLAKDGREIPIEIGLNPIRTTEGQFVLASIIDITERKQAEAELRRLAQFPEQNPSPVLRISDDGTLLYANPSGRLFLAELGWKSDGVLPDVVQGVAIDARRQACPIEREISCPHGQIIWIMAVPFSDDHYVNLYGKDITERKQAEERFRLLVEAAPNAMLMVDQAGKIILVNAQTEKLFGYSRDELLGQSVEFLVPDRFRAAHPGHRARFFAEPRARAMGAGRDLYGLGKDGREIPIEIALNPIQMAQGVFVLASIIDITERKRVEQMLRDLNVELERRVATRTAELEVEVTERRQAEEVMRLALEEKKTLLEEIHHRVKNNLQIISSLLRLQGDYVKNKEDRARFDECQNRVRTIAMVHEKLYRSQNLASINFGEHVRDLANMLASTYSQAAAQVQIFTDAESVPLQLETAVPAGLIVNELVSNALKHAFPDGRRGTLKVSLHSPTPGQLLLSVEDDGVGLPPGFDWVQEHSLGLRMVHDLARQIRGTLEVRQNGGTTFDLSFPAAKPQPQSPPQP